MNEDYVDSFLPDVEGVVDPPAVVGPDPDLILEVVVELRGHGARLGEY